MKMILKTVSFLAFFFRDWEKASLILLEFHRFNINLILSHLYHTNYSKMEVKNSIKARDHSKEIVEL